MRRLVLAAALLPTVALAQFAGTLVDPRTVPNAPLIGAAQINQAMTAKVDVSGGTLSNGTISGSTITGGTINGMPVSGLSQVTKIVTATGPTVFLGGTDGFTNVANNVAYSVGTGRIGLYEHANGMSVLTIAQRAAIQAAWAPTGASIVSGGGLGVAEIGAGNAGSAGYAGYFGGSFPGDVNMNYANGGAGTGSYTATSVDVSPGTVYGCYMTAADLSATEAAMAAAVPLGARNVAMFSTPNCGTEDLVDPFATSAYWANVRAAALYGGAIALDVPPSYAILARPPSYLAMVVQMLRWANSQGIRSSLVLSPYAITTDAQGNIAGNGLTQISRWKARF